MQLPTHLRTTLIAGATVMLLSACGGGGSSSSNSPSNPVNEEPFGNTDTSDYTGRLVWGVVGMMGGANHGIRVWDMPSSSYVLELDNDAVYTPPSLSANNQAITYTEDDLENLGVPAKAYIHNIETGQRHQVPERNSDNDIRKVFEPSITSDGQTIVFVDAIHEESEHITGAAGDIISEGLATWSIGHAQPERISENLAEESSHYMICPQVSADGSRVVVLSGHGIHVVDNGNAPYLIDFDEFADLDAISLDRDPASRCPIELSEDGHRIAFYGFNDSYDSNTRMPFVYDIEDQELFYFNGLEDKGHLYSYSMSGNGQRIALVMQDVVTGEEPDMVYRNYLVDVDGHSSPQLLETFSMSEHGNNLGRNIAISRDGQTIATSIDMTEQIKIMRSDGSDVRYIQDSGAIGIGLSLTF